MGVSNEVMEVREVSAKYDLQAAKPGVPFGYKQTEVGVIPVDWDVKTVAEIGAIKTGPFGTLLKASEYSGADGVPLISVGEIGAGFIKLKEHTPKVPAIVVRRLPQYVLRTGDIVFGRKGAVERSALVTHKENGWFLGSDGISVRPHSLCNPSYLACQFQKQEVQSWLLQHAIGTTMPSLNQGVLGRVQVPYAPLPEQRAIATALSDMDALLDGLDRLIAKKRDLKQAAMQQLLTGQTRLPGFEGEWEAKYIGDIFVITAGGDLRKDQFSTEQTEKYLHPIYSNAISESGLYGYCSTFDYEENHLTITARGGIGHAVSRNGRFCAIGRLLILKPKPGYSCKFFEEYINQYLEFANESTGVPQLTAPQAAKYSVNVPTAKEQIAIATTLSDMDAEIEALEQRRQKTRDLKQAMMQELLTGRTRLL